MNTEQLAHHVSEILAHSAIKDSSQNGIQIEGARRGTKVTKICTAVDSGMAVLEEAASRGAQMLFVHHGILWGRSLPVEGMYADKVRLCMERGLNLFASHLPLDCHTEFGNSAILARHFGLTEVRSGFLHGQTPIGVTGVIKPSTRAALIASGGRLLGSSGARMLEFGPEMITRVGIVSGGTSSLFDYPELAHLDLLITGEPRQSNYHEAMERKLNLLFIGHYASETVGVRALGEHLAAHFGLVHEFIDLPTGI